MVGALIIVVKFHSKADRGVTFCSVGLIDVVCSTEISIFDDTSRYDDTGLT